MSGRVAVGVDGSDSARMKALVAYETLSSETIAAAEQIASSLRAKGMEAEAVPVGQLDPLLAGSVDPVDHRRPCSGTWPD